MKLIKTLLVVPVALAIVTWFPVVANTPGTTSTPAPHVVFHGPKPHGAYGPLYGPNYTRRVVLSFDDCPRSRQAFVRVVRSARRHNIGLVLAPTGQCLINKNFVTGIARNNGQYVINHTVSHPDLRRLTSQGIRRELGRPGVLASYGRPPYGALNQRVRRAYAVQHMRIWLWTVDSRAISAPWSPGVPSLPRSHASKATCITPVLMSGPVF